MSVHDDTPLEPPDRSSYRMPRLPMVRGIMWTGVLLFLAGGALLLIHIGLGGWLLWHIAMYLFCAGMLLTIMSFAAEIFIGARLKPEDDSGGGDGKPEKPTNGGT